MHWHRERFPFNGHILIIQFQCERIIFVIAFDKMPKQPRRRAAHKKMPSRHRKRASDVSESIAMESNFVFCHLSCAQRFFFARSSPFESRIRVHEKIVPSINILKILKWCKCARKLTLKTTIWSSQSCRVHIFHHRSLKPQKNTSIASTANTVRGQCKTCNICWLIETCILWCAIDICITNDVNHNKEAR